MNHEEEEEQKENNFIKIVIVGQSSVGKTALINQYMNKIFIDAAITTIGTDKFIKIEKINNSEIKLNIWDTAGQERFRSLSPLFLKGSNIVIMVYDITNKESFDELDTFWLEKIKDNTKNIILGLAANKSDLYESEVVTIEEAKNFAKNNNAFFFETTAKNYESTRLLFIELVTKYIEKYGFVNENAKNLVIDKDKNKNKNNTKKGCCSK
jgi:small GTP-binding protein